MVNDGAASGADTSLHVAGWDAANRCDAQLAALADALLEHLPDNFLEPTVDLRSITTRVNGAIQAAKDEPLPKLTPTDSEDGYHEAYPVRPGAEVCKFFQQCGYCKFLGDCVKTHPPEQRVKLNRGGFPLRPGKQHCPSYLRTAFCPLMKACMMHHPNLLMEAPAADAPVDTGKADAEKPKRGKTFEHDKMEVVEEGDWTAGYPQHPKAAVCETFMRFGGCEDGASCRLHHPLEEGIVLNNYGLPMRTKAVTCDFFTRTGICKFGRTCRKHHPHLKPGPPIRKAPFRVPRLLQMPPDSPYYVVDEVTGGFPEFPQNPGKPPCPHFVRTGHCGYGARCPHHHPVQYSVKRNMDGLPLRPGKELCKFYVAKRACAYGEACVLHHPNICRKGDMPDQAPQHGGGFMPRGDAPARRDAPPRMHGGARGGGERGRSGIGSVRGGPMGPRDGMHAPPPQQQPFIVQTASGEPMGAQPPVMIVQHHQLAQMMPQALGPGQVQGMMQAPLQMAPYGQPPMQPYAMGGQPVGHRNGPFGQ